MGKVRVVQTDAGLSLRGDLTVDTVSGVLQATRPLAGKDCVLDLSEVGNVDSAGLALLVYWMQEATRRNCRLRPCNVPGRTRSLMRILGLTELLAPDPPEGSGQG